MHYQDSTSSAVDDDSLDGLVDDLPSVRIMDS